MEKKTPNSGKLAKEKTKSNMNDDLEALAVRHDRFNMAGVIERTPGQIEYALADANFPRIPEKPYTNVIIAGMGGSALPVEVLETSFYDRFRIPVDVCRNYRCRSKVTPMTLAIASSFSGNTEETLTAVEDIAERGAQVLAIAAKGKLEETALKKGYPFVKIPHEREGKGFQPRCATGYVVTYLARMLASAGVLEDPLPELSNLPPFLHGLEIKEEARETARWFAGKIPVIYTDSHFEKSIARIFKIKLNENAKRPAFYYSLPEANHNEMIGFSNQNKNEQYAVLYVKDPASDKNIHLRFEVMQELFRDSGIDHVQFRQWTLPGSNHLEKIFAGLMFGDWCAYTAAMLGGIDPSPVALVEDFKSRLTGGKKP